MYECQMDIVYTDFSHSFYTIDYAILLNKLDVFGLNDRLINLIELCAGENLLRQLQGI